MVLIAVDRLTVRNSRPNFEDLHRLLLATINWIEEVLSCSYHTHRCGESDIVLKSILATAHLHCYSPKQAPQHTHQEPPPASPHFTTQRSNSRLPFFLRRPTRCLVQVRHGSQPFVLHFYITCLSQSKQNGQHQTLKADGS